MNTREISEPLVQIFQYLSNLVLYCFSFLDSITFLGTSLLRVFVAVTILGAVFSLIFTVVKGSTVYGLETNLSRSYKRKKSKDKSSKGK